MHATRPAASPRSRADSSACSELDTEETGGVRRPSVEAWMDATWMRNTQYISMKSPTLFTRIFATGVDSLPTGYSPLLRFKDVRKGGKDAFKHGTLLTFMKELRSH
jgi:hypothetical protein